MERKEFVKNLRGGKENPITMQRLYIPLNLWQDYLTVANYPYGELKFNGKIWKVMEHALELFNKESENTKSEYEERIVSLEDRIQKLEKSVYQDEEHKKSKTFAD